MWSLYRRFEKQLHQISLQQILLMVFVWSLGIVCVVRAIAWNVRGEFTGLNVTKTVLLVFAIYALLVFLILSHRKKQ